MIASDGVISVILVILMDCVPSHSAPMVDQDVSVALRQRQWLLALCRIYKTMQNLQNMDRATASWFFTKQTVTVIKRCIEIGEIRQCVLRSILFAILVQFIVGRCGRAGFRCRGCVGVRAELRITCI